MVEEKTVLAGVVVALYAASLLAFALGELMAAGLGFLVATFAIYLREVRM